MTNAVVSGVRGGKPLPTSNADRKLEVTARIESGVDAAQSGPLGPAINATISGVQGGRDASQIIPSVAASIGAGAGLACGPAAPVCSYVWGRAAGDIAKFVIDVSKGDAALGAGKMSRNQRTEEAKKLAVYNYIEPEIAKLVEQVRSEYVARLGYISEAEVRRHLEVAMRALGLQATMNPEPPGYNPRSAASYEALEVQRYQAFQAAAVRVVASYLALAAEIEAAAAAERYKVATTTSVSAGGAAAAAMAADYATSMRKISATLRAAGFSEARIAAYFAASSGSALRQRELRKARWIIAGKWALAATMAGAGLYLGTKKAKS